MSSDANAQILQVLEALERRLAEKVELVDARLAERIEGFGNQVASLDSRATAEFASLHTEVAGVVREIADHVHDTERALREDIAKARADLIVSTDRRADALAAQMGEASREIVAHITATVEASESRLRGDFESLKAEVRDLVAEARAGARDDVSAESKAFRARIADLERRVARIEQRAPKA